MEARWAFLATYLCICATLCVLVLTADAKPATAGVVRSACTPLPQTTFHDRDFRDAHASAPRFAGLCYRTIQVRDRDRAWTLQIVESGRAGPLWVAPHDDENAAFRTGLEAVWEYGGTFITVENGEARENNGVDPNRIFGEANDRCWSKDRPPSDPALIFTDTVLSYAQAGQPVIGLHNNRLNAGGVSMNLADDAYARRYRAPRPFQPRGAEFSEPDTMIIMAGATMPSRGVTPPEIAALNRLRLNVLYEYVVADRHDCSLSNYFVRHGPRRYFNVEAVDGDYDTQPAMVDALIRHIADTRP